MIQRNSLNETLYQNEFKGFVTHNDILKKIYFQNILKLLLKYFRNKRFSKQKCKKRGYFLKMADIG